MLQRPTISRPSPPTETHRCRTAQARASFEPAPVWTGAIDRPWALDEVGAAAVELGLFPEPPLPAGGRG